MNEPRYGSLGSSLVRYVPAIKVQTGDVIDGVPITHTEIQRGEKVLLCTDDGRAMRVGFMYLVPVDRRQIA